jgi:hypothetical protein
MLWVIILPGIPSRSQDSPFELKGYLSNMQQVLINENLNGGMWMDNLFHNRLNFYWYGGEYFTGSLQIRNRLMYGETIKSIPGYAEMAAEDMGWMDLSINVLEGESYFLNTAIDRVWLQYSREGVSITAGRQRINWGQTFVWNVNDVFNAYSYFDFDYEERPGSDAVRLEIFPNYTSTIELAAKIDSSKRITAAALYRFNILSYDVQFLGGILQEEDYFGGLGWSGNLAGAGFRGEATYFHPVSNPGDTSGMFMLSAGIDYTFPNTLMLQGEYLYSSRPFESQLGFLDYYSGTLTVKELAFAEHTLFISGSYQITPLFGATLAGMYFPDLKGYFFGPSLSYNVLNNIDLGFFVQYFNSEEEDPRNGNTFRQEVSMLFLRLKWNF